MNTRDLITFTRTSVLRDVKKPPLWSDAELLEFANEAQEKAARNGRLLRDATTPEVCRISLNTSRQYYDLDPRVIFVRRVSLDSRTQPLRKISFKDLDQQQPGWQTRTGSPDRYCLDFESGRVWFNRKPTVADVARLFVVRMPLEALTFDTKSCPEIAIAYHRPLHHWIAYRAYSKDDADTKDDAKAARHLASFEQEFGEDSRAINEEWERQHYGDNDGEGEL